MAGSSLVQVVNYEEEFNSEVKDFLKECGVSERRDCFHVVSIIGPQSSGKSTLLNMLFHTDFRTMNAESGRYQVTQGVWLGYDKSMGVVVMDLEGTDSRERGEDATSFERKSSLFALAMSEIVMINIWTTDIGRLSASNLLLLKNILEIDLQLFFTAKKSSGESLAKTKLLFVLRDHATGPLDKLTDILTTDVRKIWDSINKPEGLTSAAIEDFFDLEFYDLPHKNFAPEEFQASGERFRQRFQNGDYFHGELYNRGVDADGLSLYAENVWSTIMSNRELDIPSQREMISVVKCDEALDEAMAAAKEAIARMDAEERPIASLEERSLFVFDSATEQFTVRTARQVSKIRARKAEDLAERLGQEIARVYASQIHAVSEPALATFQRVLDELRDRDEPCLQFGELAEVGMREALSVFDAQCRAPTGIAPAATKVASGREEFERSLADLLAKTRGDVVRFAAEKMTASFLASVKSSIVPLVDAAESTAIWSTTTEAVRAALEQVERTGQELLGPKGVSLTERAFSSTMQEVHDRCLSSVVDEIKRVIGGPEGVLRRMKQRFTNLFRFDESHHPRVWGPRDDVSSVFEAARQGSWRVADVLSKIDLDGFAEEVVIEEGALRELKQQVDSEASVAFVDARHAQEMARMQTKVPMWAIALLAVLGYDEAKQVFRRPSLFFSLLLAFLVLYVIYFLGLHEILLAPLRSMAAPYIRQLQTVVEGYVGVLPEPPQAQETASTKVPSQAQETAFTKVPPQLSEETADQLKSKTE